LNTELPPELNAFLFHITAATFLSATLTVTVLEERWSYKLLYIELISFLIGRGRTVAIISVHREAISGEMMDGT